MDKEEYIKFFQYMEKENNKYMLGGMAWDEIYWKVHEAVEQYGYFTIENLAELFPGLFK